MTTTRNKKKIDLLGPSTPTHFGQLIIDHDTYLLLNRHLDKVMTCFNIYPKNMYNQGANWGILSQIPSKL